MNVLGVNIGHDRAAALIQDGKIISYIAEERLDRNKHSFDITLPVRAIRYVLTEADLDLDSIDIVGFSSAGMTKDRMKFFITNELASYFGRVPIEIVGHHLSHACTAYYCSPYEQAAIWVADGGGDFIIEKGQEAESYFVAINRKIIHIHTRFQAQQTVPFTDNNFHVGIDDYNKNISLGRKYEQITYFLGFHFGQCGKTMGLASYGRDQRKWRPRVKSKGLFDPNVKVEHLIVPLLNDLDRFARNTLMADAAAEVQSFIEECALLCLEQLYIQVGGIPNLCIAGGIGLNCVLNSRILKESKFQSVFVFPAAGDDGQAIGNALYCYFVHGGMKRYPFINASLGRIYSQKEILSAIEEFGVEYSHSLNIIHDAAKLLANGAIIGWFQEGSECGPRALGFRSILADPRNPEIKDILNSRVKHREPFRPFAPAVIEELSSEYFVYPQSNSLAFMLLTGQVHPHKRSLIPGVVHVDGSARLQTVNIQNNKYLYQLLKSFYKITGIPILLNTSFNIAGEPLVETPVDAIKCFLSTGIDYLIISDFLIKK